MYLLISHAYMEDLSDTSSSSESEYISSKESLRNSSQSSEDELNQVDYFLPYQDEHIASSDAESDESSGESSQDADGLTPQILELRFEGNVDVDYWYGKYCFHSIIFFGGVQ